MQSLNREMEQSFETPGFIDGGGVSLVGIQVGKSR